MISLPIPSEIIMLHSRAGLTSRLCEDSITRSLEYLLDKAIALRIDGLEVRSTDYGIDILSSGLITVYEFNRVIDWYAPRILESMLVGNIDNPYIVLADNKNFSIENKKEYSI